MTYRNWVSVFLIKNWSQKSGFLIKNRSSLSKIMGGVKLAGWGGGFLMVCRNNAGRLGAGFINVCFETRWLGHFGGFYVPG